jgi:hypothetical protein
MLAAGGSHRARRLPYLGLCQLKITDFDEILDLVNKVREANAGHVEKAASIFGVDGRTLGLAMFLLQVGNDLEDLGVVRIETLNKRSVELNLLKLVAISHVSLALKLVVHSRKTVQESISLAVSLGL